MRHQIPAITAACVLLGVLSGFGLVHAVSAQETPPPPTTPASTEPAPTAPAPTPAPATPPAPAAPVSYTHLTLPTKA